MTAFGILFHILFAPVSSNDRYLNKTTCMIIFINFTGRSQSSKIYADSVVAGGLYKSDEILRHFDPSSKILQNEE